jgi:hypothetical protein
MRWPEKVTFSVATVIVLLLLFMGATGPAETTFGSPHPQYPAAFSGEWLAAFADILFTVGLKVILPLWLVLRIFDLIFLAPRRARI